MDIAFCNTSASAHGTGVVPLQHVMMSNSPVCVKETPTIDPSESTDNAMPSQPEPALKRYATPVVLIGEGKNQQHNLCSSSFATQVQF